MREQGENGAMAGRNLGLVARWNGLSGRRKALLAGVAVAAVLALLGLGEGEQPPVALGQEQGEGSRVQGEGYKVAARPVTEWKAVYGQVEAKDRLPARARIGGTLVELLVAEGAQVAAGQVIGRIMDEKLAFQLGAVEAQLTALRSQLGNAQAELARGEGLLKRGVATAQKVEALRTQVEVVQGQIEAQEAQAAVVRQQAAEGAVLAPMAGQVLDVPAAEGAVVMAGETLAEIGGGGVYLRLAVPERFAGQLREGAGIVVETPEQRGVVEAKLAKVYPQIVAGRVTADVEGKGLAERFIGARVLVRLPVGTRQAVMVPERMVATRAGLDFVVMAGAQERVVVVGGRQVLGGEAMVEIISGLAAGEVIAVPQSALEVPEPALPEALGAAVQAAPKPNQGAAQ